MLRRARPRADGLVAIASQEVVDRLHTKLDRAGRAILVEVLEREIRPAGRFDDLLDDRVHGRIVAALEAGELERDEVRVPRANLAAQIFWLVFSDVVCFQTSEMSSGCAIAAVTHLVAEQALEQILVPREASSARRPGTRVSAVPPGCRD